MTQHWQYWITWEDSGVGSLIHYSYPTEVKIGRPGWDGLLQVGGNSVLDQVESKGTVNSCKIMDDIWRSDLEDRMEKTKDLACSCPTS